MNFRAYFYKWMLITLDRLAENIPSMNTRFASVSFVLMVTITVGAEDHIGEEWRQIGSVSPQYGDILTYLQMEKTLVEVATFRTFRLESMFTGYFDNFDTVDQVRWGQHRRSLHILQYLVQLTNTHQACSYVSC